MLKVLKIGKIMTVTWSVTWSTRNRLSWNLWEFCVKFVFCNYVLLMYWYSTSARVCTITYSLLFDLQGSFTSIINYLKIFWNENCNKMFVMKLIRTLQHCSICFSFRIVSFQMNYDAKEPEPDSLKHNFCFQSFEYQIPSFTGSEALGY